MPRLRYVLAAAITALVIAATSATATTLITGAQVKDHSLTGADIAPRSIGQSALAPNARATALHLGPRVAAVIRAAKRRALRGLDRPHATAHLSATSRGPRGRRGRRGLRGPQGPQGAPGPPGAPGVFTAANVGAISGPVIGLCSAGAQCSVGSSTAYCPTGKVTTGGGWVGDSNFNTATVAYNGLARGNGSWIVVAINDSPTPTSFAAGAQCAG